MTKIEFVRDITDIVKKDFSVSQKETDAYLSAIREVICKKMAEDEDVSIPGIIKFTTVDVDEKERRNPRTGEAVLVPAHKKVKAKILGELKRSV